MPTIVSGRDKLQGVTPRFFWPFDSYKKNYTKYHKTYKVLITYR